MRWFYALFVACSASLLTFANNEVKDIKDQLHQESKIEIQALKQLEPDSPSSSSTTPEHHSLISTDTKVSLVSQIVVFMVLAMAAVIVIVKLKQKGFGAFKFKKDAGKLKIAEIKDLGNRQFLVVVEYEDQKILLGVTPGNISNLGHLMSPFSNPNFLSDQEDTPPES